MTPQPWELLATSATPSPIVACVHDPRSRGARPSFAFASTAMTPCAAADPIRCAPGSVPGDEVIDMRMDQIFATSKAFPATPAGVVTPPRAPNAG